MTDKILVILMVTLLCLAILGVVMHSTETMPDTAITLIEKAMYGSFGIASGTGIGLTLAGKKNKIDETTTKQEVSK